MTVNDLTEKQVDVLVNGNLEDSFDQRANNADYNIDISENSIQWGSTTNYERHIDDEDVIETLPSKNLYYMEGQNQVTYGTDIEIHVDGTRVLTLKELGDVVNTTVVANADATVSINLVASAGGDGSGIDAGFDSEDYDFSIQNATNISFMTDKGDSERMVINGISVNSIAQS